MPIILTEVECAIGDTLRVGEEVELAFFKAPGRAIRIGVKAPSSLSIQRREIAAGTDDNGAAPTCDRIWK